jgi:hypothetical protein
MRVFIWASVVQINWALVTLMKRDYLSTCCKRLVNYMLVLSCVIVFESLCITHMFDELAGCTVTLIVPLREATVRRLAAQTADGKEKSASPRFTSSAVSFFNIVTPWAQHQDQ